jgi:hypothetical protein
VYFNLSSFVKVEIHLYKYAFIRYALVKCSSTVLPLSSDVGKLWALYRSFLRLESIRWKSSQSKSWRMPSPGTLRRVALVGSDVWEKRTSSIIMVTRLGELGTTLAVISNQSRLRRNTLTMEAICSSETQFLQQPHGVTSRKMEFFIVTAVKISNITKSKLSYDRRSFEIKFPFYRLLLLAGLQWRYSILPPHGERAPLTPAIKPRVGPNIKHRFPADPLLLRHEEQAVNTISRVRDLSKYAPIYCFLVILYYVRGWKPTGTEAS